jgi:hypothetical protein
VCAGIVANHGETEHGVDEPYIVPTVRRDIDRFVPRIRQVRVGVNLVRRFVFPVQYVRWFTLGLVKIHRVGRVRERNVQDVVLIR